MRMTTRKLPVFNGHKHVRCFRCEAWLASPRVNVDGTGQYYAHCIGGSGEVTWFDLAAGAPADDLLD